MAKDIHATRVYVAWGHNRLFRKGYHIAFWQTKTILKRFPILRKIFPSKEQLSKAKPWVCVFSCTKICTPRNIPLSRTECNVCDRIIFCVLYLSVCLFIWMYLCVFCMYLQCQSVQCVSCSVRGVVITVVTTLFLLMVSPSYLYTNTSFPFSPPTWFPLRFFCEQVKDVYESFFLVTNAAALTMI